MHETAAGQAGRSISSHRDPPPAPLAPVHAAQAQLVSEIDALHSVINDLYERLSQVMGPPQDTKEGLNKGASADVTVAQKIDTAARNVHEATARLIDIRNRLEI